MKLRIVQEVRNGLMPGLYTLQRFWLFWWVEVDSSYDKGEIEEKFENYKNHGTTLRVIKHYNKKLKETEKEIYG